MWNCSGPLHHEFPEAAPTWVHGETPCPVEQCSGLLSNADIGTGNGTDNAQADANDVEDETKGETETLVGYVPTPQELANLARRFMEDIGVPQEYIDSTPETSLQEFGDTLVELEPDLAPEGGETEGEEEEETDTEVESQGEDEGQDE